MIIFLYGPDTFRSQQKLQQLKTKFLAEVDHAGLNVQILDGEKLDAQQFEIAVCSPPFLAKKRLVIIKDLIAKNRGQKIQKEILELLANNNLDTTILIFWEGDLATKSKKPARSKTSARRSHLLFDRLTEEQYAQEFGLLEPAAVKQWARSALKQKNGQIEPAALDMLVDFVGNDLWQLNSELDKLVAFCAGKPITTGDIEQLVKTKLDDDVFKLTEALGQKNRPQALRLITHQLNSGTSPTELLSKITWQTRNTLLIKDFVERNGPGYPPDRLTYQLGLHPFVIKKTMAQIKNHRLDQLKSMYRQLLAIDYKLKTSQTTPEVLFDLLVVKN